MKLRFTHILHLLHRYDIFSKSKTALLSDKLVERMMRQVMIPAHVNNASFPP
jgi:hypothetical protein